MCREGALRGDVMRAVPLPSARLEASGAGDLRMPHESSNFD